MQSNNFIPFDESDEYINEINRKYAHREVKNAKESERFLNEVCRYCNLYARCIETERYEKRVIAKDLSIADRRILLPAGFSPEAIFSYLLWRDPLL